jgi:hypothetical protein
VRGRLRPANANPACSGGRQIASCKGSWANWEGGVGLQTNTATTPATAAGATSVLGADQRHAHLRERRLQLRLQHGVFDSGSTCSTCRTIEPLRLDLQAVRRGAQGKAHRFSGGACSVACKSGFSKCS